VVSGHGDFSPALSVEHGGLVVFSVVSRNDRCGRICFGELMDII
jgi:hypothetical protein